MQLRWPQRHQPWNEMPLVLYPENSNNNILLFLLWLLSLFIIVHRWISTSFLYSNLSSCASNKTMLMHKLLRYESVYLYIIVHKYYYHYYYYWLDDIFLLCHTYFRFYRFTWCMMRCMHTRKHLESLMHFFHHINR